jgi:hypothetical protein
MRGNSYAEPTKAVMLADCSDYSRKAVQRGPTGNKCPFLLSQ